MRYNVIIINSENPYKFWDNSADGIQYDNLEYEDLDKLIELSLKQNYSVIVKKDKEEG